MTENLDKEQPRPAVRVLKIVGWCLGAVVVSFLMAGSALWISQIWDWLGKLPGILLLLVVGFVWGFIVIRLYKGHRFLLRSVVMWLVVFAMALVLFSWATATTAAVINGVEPGPGETMDTPIGWFTGEFWYYFWQGSIGMLLFSVAMYAVGASTGYSRWERLNKAEQPNDSTGTGSGKGSI